MKTSAAPDLISQHRSAIHEIAARHGVTGVRVFGSIARGEAGPASDVDLLVETGPELSPWFPVGFVLELEELLGRRVEVVTARALHPELREAVLRDAKPV
jgi:uncharacterized protein